MYIYRAVRSRGKSLQEGANQLKKYCHNIQLFPLSNSHRLRTPNPWLVVPSNARGKRLQWTQPHLCAKNRRNTAVPWGRASGSHTGSWPYQNLVSKAVF